MTTGRVELIYLKEIRFVECDSIYMVGFAATKRWLNCCNNSQMKFGYLGNRLSFG
jgi:hypothetical protein